jgi:hypothetical protein
MHGIDHMLHLVKRHVAHQVLGRLQQREVLRGKLRHLAGVDVAVFQLHWQAVFAVHAQRMEHRLARAQVQRSGHFQRGRDALHRQHIAAVVVPALADFAGQVGNLQQRGLGLVFGHKAAHARHGSTSSRSGRFTVMREMPNSHRSLDGNGCPAPAGALLGRRAASLTCWYSATGRGWLMRRGQWAAAERRGERAGIGSNLSANRQPWIRRGSLRSAGP